jgi:hypothetical protein
MAEAKVRKRAFQEEYLIETEILHWLNRQPGTFAFKVETSGYYDASRGFYRKRKSKFFFKGTLDIVGCKAGEFFSIEVKTPKGRVSPEQKAFISFIVGAGGKATVCRSLADAQMFFQSI